MLGKVRAFFTKYERWVSPVTLVGGFVFDNLTLRRIDVFFSNALLITYLVVSALAIMALNVREHRHGETVRASIVHLILVFVMQFCLGGLFSASFLFYSRSGSIIASWPFLVMILAYVLGNEFLRKNYVRLGFQISVFFTALFSYFIFFIPVILGKMGDSIFLLSGIASLIICWFFIYMLSWVAPARILKAVPILFLSIFGIFAVMNTLYFTNLIPPIPLALKEAGVYQSITKITDGVYQVVGEKQSWFNIFSTSQVIHVNKGRNLYAFSAIFAPANLSTNIIHDWQYYDEATKSWISTTKINLAISGGRDTGFRTYSSKEVITPGLWRVDVETPRGQLIGRLTFTVAYTTGAEKTTTEIK